MFTSGALSRYETYMYCFVFTISKSMFILLPSPILPTIGPNAAALAEPMPSPMIEGAIRQPVEDKNVLLLLPHKLPSHL